MLSVAILTLKFGLREFPYCYSTIPIHLILSFIHLPELSFAHALQRQKSEEEFGACEGSIYKQENQLSSCSHGLTFRINLGLTLRVFLGLLVRKRHKASGENCH